MKLVLPAEYPYAMMALAANFLQCQLFAPTFVLPARLAAFTKDHLAQYEGEHKAAFGENAKIDSVGNPDQGNGWYSRSLDFEQWCKMNQAQRVLMNYIESFPYLIAFTLLSGIYFPIYACIGAWGILLGRFVYSVGYKIKPQARVFGALMMFACNLMMMILSMCSVFMLLEGNSSTTA